jgi:hypothetical protein
MVLVEVPAIDVCSYHVAAIHSSMVSEAHVLTDAVLRNLKPKDKAYKVTGRDGLYVYVLKSGTISFRYNYAINGMQETLVLGRYSPDGIKLSEARELLVQAKKTLAAGRSPARQKVAAAAREKAGNTTTLRPMRNRRGNSPRFSISRMVRSHSGTFCRRCLRGLG